MKTLHGYLERMIIMLANIITEIAAFLTYLQTGIHGDETMNLSELLVYLPRLTRNEKIVGNVMFIMFIIGSAMMLIKLIKMYKKIEMEED